MHTPDRACALGKLPSIDCRAHRRVPAQFFERSRYHAVAERLGSADGTSVNDVFSEMTQPGIDVARSLVGPMLVLTLTLAIATLGCSSAGVGRRADASFDERGVVAAGADRGVLSSNQVSIRRVVGPGCGQVPCESVPFYARLRAGVYAFDVTTTAGMHVFHDALLDATALVADGVSAVAREHHRQRITFAVESGKTHAIHLDPDTHEYRVSVRPGIVAPGTRPALTPPADAYPCLPVSSPRHVPQCTQEDDAR